MKKKILLLALVALLVMPIATLAESKTVKYESQNLEETLTAEDIELAFENYKETDDQVTIYLFRSAECTYCREFLKFLNESVEEYGKYFKLESYEVSMNQNNGELFHEIAEFLGQQASGVPFIIIGEEAFIGYGEGYGEEMLAAVKEEYDAKEKYDVMEEYEKYKKKEERKEFYSSGKFTVIYSTIISLIASAIIMVLVNLKIKKLTERIEKLESANNHKKKSFFHHKEDKKHNNSKE